LHPESCILQLESLWSKIGSRKESRGAAVENSPGRQPRESGNQQQPKPRRGDRKFAVAVRKPKAKTPVAPPGLDPYFGPCSRGLRPGLIFSPLRGFFDSILVLETHSGDSSTSNLKNPFSVRKLHLFKGARHPQRPPWIAASLHPASCSPHPFRSRGVCENTRRRHPGRTSGPAPETRQVRRTRVFR
jgi:hypothetical protein